VIYFDSAATGFLKPPAVKRAVLWAMEHCASPGRGGYEEAMRAAETVFRCRERCGRLFDCRPEQVVLTSSATHSLNIAIKDLVRPGDRVVVSGFEHNAVVRPLAALGAEICVAGTKLFDREDTLQAFRHALTPDTKAVICTHVSNVFGYILPIGDLAKLCREREIPLIVDAAQSAGVLPVSLKELGAAYIALPGHKGLMGPQGTGVLLCGKMPDVTLLEGGTGSLSKEWTMPDFLPDRLEPGTCNVPGAAGLSEGVQYVLNTGVNRIFAHENGLLKYLIYNLRANKNICFFAGKDQTGVLSILVKGEDCEQTAARLARSSVAVRAGLQCAPLAHQSAGTLETGTVRISLSPFSTRRDAEYLLHALKK